MTFTIFGLILSILGSITIAWKPSKEFLEYNFLKNKRKEIEDRRINFSLGMFASEERDENLEFSDIKDYKTILSGNFWGLALLILGFVFQLLGCLNI